MASDPKQPNSSASTPEPAPRPLVSLAPAAIPPVTAVATSKPPVAPPAAAPAQTTAAPAATAAAKATTTSTKPAPRQFELPSAVYSPALLESVVYDIQFYLDWIRQNKIRSKVGAKAKAAPSHSAETELVIESWLVGQPATIESLGELLDHLRGLNLPEAHLVLAALPNRAQRETLVNWFRANCSSQLLLSFVADRNIGGGVVVRTPNRVFDCTWKQQLVEGRSKLAEILKRV